MTINALITIDSDRKLVFLKPQGEFSDMDEFRSYLEEKNASIIEKYSSEYPDVQEYPIVHDLNGLIPPKTLDYRTMSSHAELLKESNTPTKVAFVADDDLKYGTVRMFLATQSKTRSVFRTSEEAVAWALQAQDEP